MVSFMKNNQGIFTELNWPVDQHGYEFIEVDGEDFMTGRQSTMKVIIGKGGPSRKYSPMVGEHSIHRDLADADDTDEGVLEFCSKYGLISHDRVVDDLGRLGRKSPGGGTPLFNKASGMIGVDYATGYLDMFLITQSQARKAIHFLDQSLPGEAADIFNLMSVHVTPQIDLGGIRKKKSWRLIPNSLGDAVWMMIEKEISGEVKWRECENCKTWFVPPSAKRKYCKDSCKTAAYRQRKNTENK
jgi:hypothetical protein